MVVFEGHLFHLLRLYNKVKYIFIVMCKHSERLMKVKLVETERERES